MKGRQASGRKPESDRRAQKPSTLQEKRKLTESDWRDQDNASALRERLTRLSEASLHSDSQVVQLRVCLISLLRTAVETIDTALS